MVDEILARTLQLRENLIRSAVYLLGVDKRKRTIALRVEVYQEDAFAPDRAGRGKVDRCGGLSYAPLLICYNDCHCYPRAASSQLTDGKSTSVQICSVVLRVP